MDIYTSNQLALEILDALGLEKKHCSNVSINLEAGTVAQISVTYAIPQDVEIVEVIKKFKLVEKNTNGTPS